MPRIRPSDGVTVWYNSELSADELFAAGLIRAVLAQEMLREHQAGRGITATGRRVTVDQAQYKEELGWLGYFLQWFRVEFGEVFPGRSAEWLPKYRRGLDGLVDKQIVGDVRKGACDVPGAATASELWFPRLVWFDRIERSPVVYREGG